jgi:uncharacterized membrane protein YdjX (TVP38/TMEM64 family)
MSQPTPRAAPRASWQRWLAVGLVLAVAIGFAASGWGGTLLARLTERRDDLQALARAHPIASAAAFVLAGTLLMALSVPVAVLLSLSAGVLFGVFEGSLLMSVASTAGATLAFLGSRYLFRDVVRRRFARWAGVVDAGVAREGAFYLFALRLTPVAPFWAVNLSMGLTAMPVRTFWWVSQVGMLPGTVLYVNAGTRLGEVSDWRGLIDPWLVGSFALLGVAPLLLKWLIGRLRKARN